MGSGFFGFDLYGDAFDYLEAGFFEGGQFFGVIGDHADFAEAEVEEDLGALLVVAGVYFEAESLVCLYGVGAVVLKRISPYFIDDPDAAAFLLLIDDGSTAFGLDHFHRFPQLRPAIALDRAKNVAGQALRMNTDERRHFRLQLALIKHDKFFVAGERAIPGDLKIPDRGRQVCRCHFFYRDRPAFPWAIVVTIRQFQILHIEGIHENYNSKRIW